MNKKPFRLVVEERNSRYTLLHQSSRHSTLASAKSVATKKKTDNKFWQASVWRTISYEPLTWELVAYATIKSNNRLRWSNL